MICPNCQNDSIPFIHVWKKSGLGTYKCPSCGASSRVKVQILLVAITFLQSASLLIGGYCLARFSGFAVGLVAAFLVDAAIDYKFQRLVSVQASIESSDNSQLERA